ncbi:hypothetical protein [Poriferisphaera corsica]|nr:hypothetical protein [Poriferisphaera corsica]
MQNRQSQNAVLIGVLLVVCALAGGCWNPFRKEPIAGSQRAGSLTNGYSLLVGLAGQESKVGLVTWVRDYDGEVGDLLEDVQEAAKDINGWLGDISGRLKSNGVLMDRNGLPEVEQWARNWIEGRTRKTILGGKIQKSELVMVLSQAKATEYIAALCAGLANIEVNDARRDKLKKYAARFESLNERCLGLLKVKGEDEMKKEKAEEEREEDADEQGEERL